MPRLSARHAATRLVAAAAVLTCLAADAPQPDPSSARWKQHDFRRPKPPVRQPSEAPATPPEGAVVLFDGTNLDAWKSSSGGPARWKVGSGVMETVPGAGPIETKAQFGDIQLHIEWAAPSPPRGRSQDRGNSGVFLMGQFEVQVLDSYRAETYADGQAGAIYGQYPPLFNASRPPGQWQTYDVAFRKPQFNSAGALTEPARITVFFNGVLVQNNEEPFGPTSWLKWLPYQDRGGRGPIMLQDHDHPVHYRNIWILELPERPAPKPENLVRPKPVELPASVLDRYVGQYLANSKPDAPKVTIAREGDHLTVTFPFRPGALEMVPVSETEFDMPFTDGHFTFHRDAEGRVTGVLFRVGDGEREMKRVTP
jgi:hypothetical protein